MKSAQKRLTVCLIVLLMVIVSLPVKADYSDKEKQNITEYVFELEKDIKLKNKKIDKLNKLVKSEQEENELLQKKVNNLELKIKQQDKECKAKQLKSFGYGVVSGAGLVLILVLK